MIPVSLKLMNMSEITRPLVFGSATRATTTQLFHGLSKPSPSIKIVIFARHLPPLPLELNQHVWRDSVDSNHDKKVNSLP